MSVPVLPNNDSTFGIWMPHKQGDIHCYMGKHHGVVIGSNKSYKDKIQFSDLALVVTPEGKITLQYAGEDGQANHKDVDSLIWREEVLRMLKAVHERVTS